MKNAGAPYIEEESQNPFALSIGDLMAALLLIFILLLASTLLRLQDEYENQTRIAESYAAIKEDLYNELMLEFEDDLEQWNASIDSKELIFRFKDPDALFEFGQSEIKPEFEFILNDFFPRYVAILFRPEFRENIEEIRIEGHTDSRGSYYYNMELSQHRTRSVLNYVLEQTLPEDYDKTWIQMNLTANGLSFSKPIDHSDTELGRSLNRRVEFRIRTNAEKQIEEILSLELNE